MLISIMTLSKFSSLSMETPRFLTLSFVFILFVSTIVALHVFFPKNDLSERMKVVEVASATNQSFICVICEMCSPFPVLESKALWHCGQAVGLLCARPWFMVGRC